MGLHLNGLSQYENDLRKKLLNQLMRQVLPKKGKDRLLSMIEGRPDWCVSRQRVWEFLYQFHNKTKNH